MQTRNLNFPCQTIDWLGDALVDWASGGSALILSTGRTCNYAQYHLHYRFDGVVTSADKQYVLVYEKYGTKALLLKMGVLIREINRSYYEADAYEFPAVFFEFQDRTYLAHCPAEYCRIDFEDVETGEIVTNMPRRKPGDFFHSRLEVSPDGKYLLSKGWVWHPMNEILLFNIEKCFSDPCLLDDGNIAMQDINSERCTASFIDEQHILLGTSTTTWDTGKVSPVPPSSIAVWRFTDNVITAVHTPAFSFGNLFAINFRYCWDLYRHPKIIDIQTGELVEEATEINSGEQQGALIGNPTGIPLMALSSDRMRLAVKSTSGQNGVVVVSASVTV